MHKNHWSIWPFKRKLDRSRQPVALQRAALLTVYEGDCATTTTTKRESPSLSEYIGSHYFKSQNLFQFIVGVLTILLLVSKLSRHHAYRIVRECKDSYIRLQYVEIQYIQLYGNDLRVSLIIGTPEKGQSIFNLSLTFWSAYSKLRKKTIEKDFGP